METPQERVARSVALLDRERPNWRNYVKPERLVMSSCLRCVLGQVFGDYTEGYDKLFDDPDREHAAAHGFDAGEHSDDYSQLAEEWKRQIAKR